MKMKRKLVSGKFLSLFVVLTLLLGMLPMSVFAAEEVTSLPIYVGGVQVTSDNKADVLGDGTVSVAYDEETSRWVITLHDANISMSKAVTGIFVDLAKETVELRLEGENHISTTSREAIYFAHCDLVITGSGTLELTSEDSNAVGGSTLNSNSQRYGGNLTITGVSSFKASGRYLGINITGSLSVEDSNAEISCRDEYNAAVRAGNNSSVNISGSTVTVKTKSGADGIAANTVHITKQSKVSIESDQYSINASGSEVVVDNSSLDVASASACGVFCVGDIRLENGASVTAKGSYAPIYAYGAVNINAGTVNAETEVSESNGIYAGTEMVIENRSHVTAKGTYPGLFASNAISVSNSYVEAKSSEDLAVWSGGVVSVFGDSEMIADGGIGAAEDVILTPAEEERMEVLAGTSAEDEEVINGSPFSEEVSLLDYDISSYTYIHTRAHVHVFDQENADEKYVVTAASCTNRAVYHKSCRCGEAGTETFQYGEVIPHTFGAWVVIKEPTYTEEGEKERECLICHTKQTEPLPKSVKLPYTDVTEPSEEAGVEGDWFYSYVYEAYINGWMTGKEPALFAPAEDLTRAEFVTVLYRLEGRPETRYEQIFSDVFEGEFYSEAVTWAKSIGVINGYDGTDQFGPADYINREQMAVMLYRYAQYKGYDVNKQVSLSEFPDAEKVSGYAEQAMQWCVAEKMIQGDNGNLNPGNNANRAECSAIISRFANLRL